MAEAAERGSIAGPVRPAMLPLIAPAAILFLLAFLLPLGMLVQQSFATFMGSHPNVSIV